MQHSVELRQANHYKAVRDRLFNSRPPAKTKPAPQLLVLRDFDHHVLTWKKWKTFHDALKQSVVSRSFQAELTTYPYEQTVTVTDSTEMVVPRRNMTEISLSVLHEFPGVTLDEVRGAHRDRGVVAARHACMYAIYMERKDVSFPMIGRFFNRDHTVALYAVAKVKAAMGDAESIARLKRKNEKRGKGNTDALTVSNSVIL